MIEGKLKKQIDEIPSFFGEDKTEIFDVLIKAEKEFPVEFWCDVIFVSQHEDNKVARRQMLNASLSEHRANAVIDKDKLFDWFLKWFGSK